MSEYALPCIVCGVPLRNVFQDIDNQPDYGVVVMTSGNYGSTVWDDGWGNKLEFNVCDTCLVEAAKKERVWISREWRPVEYEGFRVGFEDLPYRPLPWQGPDGPDMADRDSLVLDDDDLATISERRSVRINLQALEDAKELAKTINREPDGEED